MASNVPRTTRASAYATRSTTLKRAAESQCLEFAGRRMTGATSCLGSLHLSKRTCQMTHRGAMPMKTSTYVAIAVTAAALSGCIVAPVQPAYVAPAGVVYVAPTYVSPGPGYVWSYHANSGWGWH